MNPFESFDVKTLRESPFSLIGRRWALLSAGTPDAWNTMTVSWGQLGVLWNKNVATVYVRPQRYTLGFVEKNDLFSLSFFGPEQHAALQYCGAHSGRDGNKAAATGLKPLFDGGAVLFEQAELTLVCRKLYRQQLEPGCFIDPVIDRQNYHGDYHYMFIGEIMGCYRKN